METGKGSTFRGGWTRWVILPLNAAAVIAAAVMLILLLIGFCEIGGSIRDYAVGEGGGEEEGLSPRLEVMKTTVKSFELMLLAPLPFLLIVGLAQYLRAVTGQTESGTGRLLLTEAKALWVGLLVGVFATDLLDKTLREGIGYEESIATGIVMGILIVYFYLLERLTRARRKAEGAEG